MNISFQPYIDLANANMLAFTRLTGSPEIPKMMKSDTDTYLQQTRGFFAHAAKSDALTEWSQTVVKNYSDFLTAISQSFYGMMGKSQAYLADQTKELSNTMQRGVDEAVHAQESMVESVDAEMAETTPVRTKQRRSVEG